jgi:hypothetical protein
MTQTEANFEDFAKRDLIAGVQHLAQLDALFHQDTLRCLRRCHELEQQSHQFRTDRELFREYQFWCRALLRALFAHVEGLSYVMRRIVLWAHERGECELSFAEVSLLREESYSYNVQRKRIDKRHSPNRLLENLLLAFDLFPRTFGANFKLQLSDHRWDSFQTALRARHAITHPKTVEEFILTAEGISHLKESIAWFGENIKAVLNAGFDGYRARTTTS